MLTRSIFASCPGGCYRDIHVDWLQPSASASPEAGRYSGSGRLLVHAHGDLLRLRAIEPLFFRIQDLGALLEASEVWFDYGISMEVDLAAVVGVQKP